MAKFPCSTVKASPVFNCCKISGPPKSVFAVFDCLYKDGKDLRARPLSERRAVLEESTARNKLIVPSRRLASNGLAAYRLATERKFEGLVAKDLASRYVEGRSTFWLKVKVHQEDEFVIGGLTAPSGSRNHFGALLLGAYDRGKLHFVGKVGTGFNDETLAMLFKKSFVRWFAGRVLSPTRPGSAMLLF